MSIWSLPCIIVYVRVLRRTTNGSFLESLGRKLDQTYIDVPARGSLDLPGLVGSVIEITKSIRLCAKSEDRNALWLYLSSKGAVRRLRAYQVSKWMLKQFVVQEKIFLVMTENFSRILTFVDFVQLS